MSCKLSDILAGNISKTEAHPAQTDSISLHYMQTLQIYMLLFLEGLFASFLFLSFVVSRVSELYRTVTTITYVRKLGIGCTAKDIAPK